VLTVTLDNQHQVTQQVNQFLVNASGGALSINRRANKKIALIGIGRDECRVVVLEDNTSIKIPKTAPLGSKVLLSANTLIYFMDNIRYKFLIR